MLRDKALLLAWFAVFATAAGVSAQAPDGAAAAQSDQTTQQAPATPAPRRTLPLTTAATQANHQTPPETSPEGGNPSGNPQQPQIIVQSPPPAPAEWNWHDRVLWGAYIVLAVLGYVGIIIALRTLKSIERHSESASATSKAALGSAAAALLRTQAVVEAERPWIVVTIEPFLTVENSFKVMATNRGRTPAQLTSTVDQISVAVDETHLPETPQFDPTDSNNLPAPVILLPGESVGIRPFSRDEVSTICKTREEMERVELWEEKIFLYGKVTYRELLNLNPSTHEEHETIWCCRYIHGESKSALVITGPPHYNHHT